MVIHSVGGVMGEKQSASVEDRAIWAALVGRRPWLQLGVGLPLGLTAASVAGMTQLFVGYSLNGATSWEEALAVPWPSQPIGMVLQLAASVAVMVLVAKGIAGRRVIELERPGAFREFFAGVGLGAGVIAATVGVLATAGAYRVSDVSLGRGVVAGVLLGLGSAFAEEIVMRGIVLRVLIGKLGVVLSLLISASVFGALHLATPGASVLSVVGIALQAGVLFGVAYVLTKRLWLAIGLHASWNFVQTAVFGLEVSGVPTEPGLLVAEVSGPAWLTGGNAGIEGSAITVVFGLCLSIALLHRATHRSAEVADDPQA